MLNIFKLKIFDLFLITIKLVFLVIVGFILIFISNRPIPPIVNYQNIVLIVVYTMFALSILGLQTHTYRTACYFLLSIGLLSIVIKPPAVDNIRLHFNSQIKRNSYYVFSVDEFGVDYRGSYQSSVGIDNEEKSALFKLDFHKTTADILAFRFGGAPVDDISINSIELLARILNYEIRLKTIPLTNIAADLAPTNEEFSRLTPIKNGVLVQTVVPGIPSWMAIHNARQILTTSNLSKAAIALKLIWVALLIVGFKLLMMLHQRKHGLQNQFNRILEFDTPRILTPFYPPEQKLTADEIWNRKGPLIVISWLTLLIVVLVRSWTDISQLSIPVEDGSLYFAKFYNFDRTDIIFEKPNGYYTLPTNLLALFTTLLPVQIQPYIYKLIALLACSLCCIAILFTGLFRRNAFIFLVPLALGFTGINHLFLWNTLTYQIYIFPLIIVIGLWMNFGNLKLSSFLIVFILLIGIWSGPYSIIILPVSLILFWVFPGKTNRLINLCAFMAGMAYFLSMDSITQIREFFTDSERVLDYLQTLLNEVLFLSAFEGSTLIKLGLLLAFFCLVLFFLKQNKLYLFNSSMFLLICFLSLGFYFLSTKYETASFNHAYKSYSVFFWVLFLLYSLHEIINRFDLSKYVQILIVVTVLGIVYVDNHKHSYKWATNLNSTDKQFIQAIYYFEQFKLAKRNRYVVLENLTHWYGIKNVRVVVGSRRADSKPVGVKNFQDPAIRPFIKL